MSLFTSSKASKSRRKFRPKIIHSVGDGGGGDNGDGGEVFSDESNLISKSTKKVQESEGALSFADQEVEEDYTEFKLKKRERSRHQVKAKDPNRKQTEVKKIVKLDHFEDKIDEDVNSSVHSQLSEGIIPSAATIHAARKKRELARNLGGNSTGNLKFKDKEKSSFLSDDDENSDAADGEQSSVRQFGVSEDQSKQMEVISAMDNASSGSDEEKFVEEQICKGVYSFPVSTVADSISSPSVSVEAAHTLAETTATPAPNMINLTPISIESLQSQLCFQLEHLKEQHSTNTQMISKLESDTILSNKEIDTMVNNSHSLTLRYQFFQEMRGYVRDLLMCLTEKVLIIEKLDNNMLNILKKRSVLLVDRRRQDIKDMAEECSGKVKLIEDESCRTRIIEREGRRRRRREMRSRACKNLITKDVHYDGLSSDDELLESTKNKLQNDNDEVTLQVAELFSDVLDYFSTLSLVSNHFREWKYNFSLSYDQAYISLCLPKLLSPFVRLQLITWNPLIGSDAIILEDMSWMKDLLFYQYQSNGEIDKNDSDLQLIPKIIELIVFPKLTDLVEHIYDPLSSSHTLHLKNCISYLMETFPSIPLSHQCYRSIFKMIVQKITSILERDIFVPIFPPQLMMVASSKQYQFSQRQFWTCFKLLNNILEWKNMISTGTLQEIVIDGLLNRYMLLSLQNSPASSLSITKIEKILSVIPLQWLNISSNFSGLLRYTVNLIELLQKELLIEPESIRHDLRMAISRGLILVKKLGGTMEPGHIAAI